MVTTGDFKMNIVAKLERWQHVVVVTGCLLTLTKEIFLAQSAGDCHVESILIFVDILLAPNADK